MRGLWIESGRVACRSDLDPPKARAGETRVRLLTAGVCATDLALLAGYMGFRGVPGHEFVGVALDGPHQGRRVVGEINAACGACAACAAGRDRHCPRRTVLGILGRPGAFAEELSLPDRNLHPLPDGLSTERAVFAEPLAAAFALGEASELAAGERALVVGDGRLGLLCAQVLELEGLRVTVAGRHPERAGILPQGVRHVTGLFEGDAGALPDCRGFDLAVEASGDPAVLQALFSRLRPQGTIVLKTTCERPAALDLAALVVDEIRLVGSRCGRFAPALEALAAGRINVDPMLSARYSLEQGKRAFEHAGQAGVLKVLIDNDV
jgi:threonine dehydrogenase-like Zn-dependent dehydrogenase